MDIYPHLLKIDIASICVQDSKESQQWKDTGDWSFLQLRAGMSTDKKKGQSSKSSYGLMSD